MDRTRATACRWSPDRRRRLAVEADSRVTARTSDAHLAAVELHHYLCIFRARIATRCTTTLLLSFSPHRIYIRIVKNKAQALNTRMSKQGVFAQSVSGFCGFGCGLFEVLMLFCNVQAVARVSQARARMASEQRSMLCACK
jgi:hypothetical protein